MTVDEVTAVHVEEELVVSSSSKVEIAAEEDQVKKNVKEDLSNGVNGRNAREDTDGDGDYVFVNGNDEGNGGPVESDLEKSCNGAGGGDQVAESVEIEGEVKSKTDLVKDLREEDETCIEIVDQDKDSLELCHVEAPVDEQKSGDLVQSDPVSAVNAENGVSETAMADQNGISESAEDVSDAKNVVEHTVSEAAAVDSGDKQSDEISSVSGPDVNGSTNDSVEANVLDFRSKENEEPEMAVADDSDCNGDSLANDSAEATVSDANDVDSRSKENEGSEMAVADASDCNGDCLANGSAKGSVSQSNVLDFRSKENEGSEIVVAADGDCNGDGAKAIVSEADVLDFRSKEDEGGSEMSVADDGDCSGEGLANDNAKATVFEASVINSRSKENGGSEMAVADDGDCNGNALADDNVKASVFEANVIDSRSKETEGPQMVIADDGDCNGSGLADVSAMATVFEANVLSSRLKENEGSEMAVADDDNRNGDGSADDSAKATVSEANVIHSKPNENKGSEMAIADDDICNGDGLANERAKATVSEANVLDFRSKENENSEMVVANDCNGVGLDSVKATVSEAAVDTRDVQNEVCELPVTDDGVTTISVSDRDGDCLPDVREKDTVSEAVLVDSGDEHNESSNSGEVEADSAGPVSNGKGDRPELNGFSEIPEMVLPDVVSGNESVKVGESLIAAGEFPVESGLGLEHNTERDLGSVADTNLEKETGSGSFSDDCGEALQDVHTQDGISGTVQIIDSVDSGQSYELMESFLSPITNKNVHVTVEGVLNDTIADVVEGTSATVTLCNDASVVSGVSDIATEALPSSSVDDEKMETDVIESHENSRVGFENSEIDVKDESGSIDDNFKSRCLANGDDSILSAEAEVSKVLVECYSTETNEKLADVVDVQNDSNLFATVSNDEKAPTATEKLSSADISDIEEFVHESRESDCDTNNNKQTPAVIKGTIQFGSIVACQESEEPEGLDEVDKRSPFYFLIRVPRYDDENLKEKIRLAQIKVDEKTQSRDAIRTEIQKMKSICKKYGDNVEASISQESAIRDLLRSKRQEIDSIQSMMNIEDIDAKIRNMEHMIQHETMPLKDEKQYIHQIKQYKQTRERISSTMGKQDEVQQGSDQKDQMKERMKSLKKEADQLKVNLLKAEAVTKAAKKEYNDEAEKLNKLQSQFKAADEIRQEAYSQLSSLKKQSYEKNKFFWQYRDDAKAANDLALKGDKEALQNLCVNQVEKVMDLWNNNDEFRKEYIRCNVRSTLRRLRTFDGRALGPDEEPPVIPRVVNERVAKDHSVSNSILEEQTREKTAPAKPKTATAKAETAEDKPAVKPVEQKNQTSKPEKPVKPVPPASGSTTASSTDTIEEAEEEKPKITKEEEERLRKAEELRKEQEEAKWREQRRLEEIAKAKEALERKRRNAEKAQARAALRAQKEAEEKEKEREKRAKKKERRKGAAAVSGDASVTYETEPAPTSETLQDSQSKEKPVTVAKRSQKASQFTKQSKAKSIPPPLRNRGKRRMQPWMWVVVTCLVIFTLFLVGNGNYSFSFDFGLLQKLKF